MDLLNLFTLITTLYFRQKNLRFKVLEAFQSKALDVNRSINAVVEFFEDALARAKKLVKNDTKYYYCKIINSIM
jgi:hypothetical protein